MNVDRGQNETHTEGTGITYQLHPRVLFRVSDAYTRVKVGSTASTGSPDDSLAAMEIEEADESPSASTAPCHTAVGCLLGEQRGREVEIINSFDMPSIEFDWAMFQKKLDLYKEMYPEIEVVGWYVTMPKETELGAEHVDLQKAFTKTWCPSPVVMAYDPRPSIGPGQKATDHALRLFESEEHNEEMVFRLADHELHSSDVERIVVNQFRDLLDISGDSTTQKTNAAMKNHQENLKSAVGALIERVTQLQQVLIGIREGRLEYDERVVMSIAAFVDRLPLSSDGMSLSRSGASREGLVQDQKDALLKALLASTMAGVASLETHASFDARKAFTQEETGGKQGPNPHLGHRHAQHRHMTPPNASLLNPLG